MPSESQWKEQRPPFLLPFLSLVSWGWVHLNSSWSETVLFLYNFLHNLSESVKSLILRGLFGFLVWFFGLVLGFLFFRNWQWDSYLSLPELGRWPYRLTQLLCFASHWVSPLLKSLKDCTSNALFTLVLLAIYSSAVMLSAPSALLFWSTSVLLLSPFFCWQRSAHIPSALKAALSFQRAWTAWICMVSRD